MVTEPIDLAHRRNQKRVLSLLEMCARDEALDRAGERELSEMFGRVPGAHEASALINFLTAFRDITQQILAEEERVSE